MRIDQDRQTSGALFGRHDSGTLRLMQMTLQVSETIIRVESLRKYQHFPVGYESRERGLFRSR